jgi:hypothetical protein
VATLTRIDVTWADKSSNEASFQLYRRSRVAGGAWSGWSHNATRPANTTFHLDSVGVAAGNEYQYELRACNVAGCSAWAVSGYALVPTAPPAAPSGMTATVVNSGRIDLHWTDGSTNEAQFAVYRRTKNPDGSWQPYLSFVGTGPNTTSYSDQTVVAATTYTYRIRACNAAGCSTYSTSLDVTTP